MSEQSYTTSLSLKQSPGAVFAAINRVRDWWSGEIDGATDRLGAEFTYRYQDMHWSRQQITEMVPGRRIVWHVAEARLNFVRDTAAWDGTDIIFDITPAGEGSELRFTHRGLLPAMQCYGECSGAWGFYVGESLRKLIAQGSGAADRQTADEALAH